MQQRREVEKVLWSSAVSFVSGKDRSLDCLRQVPRYHNGGGQVNHLQPPDSRFSYVDLGEVLAML